MKSIWKFGFQITGRFRLAIPKGAQVLHVEAQHGQACLWALVDPAAETEEREFGIYGTGHPLPDNLGRHVGTFLMDSGNMVWHVFEPGR